jgi:hypothetical protein
MVAANDLLDRLGKVLARQCEANGLELRPVWKFLEGDRVYDIDLGNAQNLKVIARVSIGEKKNSIDALFHFGLRWPDAEAILNKFTQLRRSRAEKYEGFPRLPPDEPGPEHYPFATLDILRSAANLPPSPLQLSRKLESADVKSLEKVIRGFRSISQESLSRFLDRDQVCNWLLSEPSWEQTNHGRHFTGVALVAAGRIEEAIRWKETVLAEMQKEALADNPGFYEVLVQLDSILEEEINERWTARPN